MPDVDAWQTAAACRTKPAAVFFPDGLPGLYTGNRHRPIGGRLSRQIETARQICSTCPVAGPCLEEALDRPEPEGIWGGLTPLERRARMLRRTA